jgi:trk system potassium uptake protein TrkA
MENENVLVLGLGGVGMHLTKRLINEGHAVTVIETDPQLIRYANEQMDVRVIPGNSMQVKLWEEAQARNTDLMLAVTNDDATNMLAALIADKFGIKRKIARVRSLDFEQGSILPASELKIDLMVHPEELVAQEIERLVRRADGNDMIDVSEGQMKVLGLRVTESSPMVGKTPRELAELHSVPFRLVAIARGISTLMPGAEEVIRPYDQLFLIATPEDLQQMMKEIGVQQRAIRRVMILGGGLVGRRVAQLLESSMDVVLIEKDMQTAEELAGRLRNTQVLHGDGTDANVLVSASLDDMDTFIATTGENETNIISCLLAKHLMNKQNRDPNGEMGKTIALVNKEDYLVLASTIGLDIALNTKISAANEILKFIRRSELLSVAHLHGVDAEVVELQAPEGSMITRKPLRKLANYLRQHQILIGGFFVNGAWKVAVGDTHVAPGARVIAVCPSHSLSDVRRLFQ